ncbi:MAG: glycosyltransferase [Halioglobus sp.]|nr:glycosyltransferase [Halioglobus sp.]
MTIKQPLVTAATPGVAGTSAPGSRLNILHVVPTYLPATRYGGPIYSVHALCKHLASAGHNVTVFTTNVDGDGESDVPLGTPVLLDGVKVCYFPSHRGRRLYWSPPMWRALETSLAGFDVVHLHSVFLWPTWAAARVARRLQVPYVVSPRGMLVKDLVRRKSRLVKSAWIALIEKRNIEHCALVHFTAELERREFAAFGFRVSRECVVPNGADVRAMDAIEDPAHDIRQAVAGGPYLLFLGRLSWKKGLDRLIAAMPHIEGHRLVIAGNDEEGYLDTIHALLRQHGVNDKVTLLPRFVSGADKAALYRGAALFALPSYSENFGNTVTEAMAFGCPAVVTSEVGAAGLVQASGCGAVTTEKGLVATLQSLLADPDKLRAQGQAGRVWAVDHLSWESVALAMADQYRRLATARNA